MTRDVDAPAVCQAGCDEEDSCVCPSVAVATDYKCVEMSGTYIPCLGMEEETMTSICNTVLQTFAQGRLSALLNFARLHVKLSVGTLRCAKPPVLPAVCDSTTSLNMLSCRSGRMKPWNEVPYDLHFSMVSWFHASENDWFCSTSL